MTRVDGERERCLFIFQPNRNVFCIRDLMGEKRKSERGGGWGGRKKKKKDGRRKGLDSSQVQPGCIHLT